MDTSTEANTMTIEDALFRHSPFGYALKIIRMSVCVLSMLFNAIAVVMSAAKCRSGSRDLIKILISYQNIADFVCASAVMFAQVLPLVEDSNPEWNRDLFTLVIYCLLLVSFTVSLANSFLIGVERFMATTRPLTYKTTFTKARLHTSAMAVWLITLIVIASPMCAYYTLGGFDMEGMHGNQKILRLVHNIPTGFAKFVGVLFSIMMLGNCLLYLEVFRCFRISVNRVNCTDGEAASRIMTLTVLSVMAVTLGCYMPTVFYFISPPYDVTGLKANFYRCGFIFLLLASFLNTFIYGTCSNFCKRQSV